MHWLKASSQIIISHRQKIFHMKKFSQIIETISQIRLIIKSQSSAQIKSLGNS